MNSKLKLANNIIKFIYYISAVLPLIMALIALPFVPDIIPLHYNSQGKVDAMGSSTELLLIAGILSATALLWGLCIKSISVFVNYLARKLTSNSTKPATQPTQAAPNLENNAETKAETEAETKAETEAETKAKTEAETKAETEAGTKAETEAGTKAETEAETKAKTEAETKPKNQEMPSHVLAVLCIELYLYVSSLLLPLIYSLIMGFIIYLGYHQITDILEYTKHFDSFIEWHQDNTKLLTP